MSALFNKWRKEMAKAMGGKFDWKKVSFEQFKDLSEEMFDIEGLTETERDIYWKAFEEYRKTLK